MAYWGEVYAIVFDFRFCMWFFFLLFFFFFSFLFANSICAFCLGSESNIYIYCSSRVVVMLDR